MKAEKDFFSNSVRFLNKTYYWLMKASKQGYDPALLYLTDMICKAEGSEKDINKAVAWFKEASEQARSPELQNCLDQIREKAYP